MLTLALNKITQNLDLTEQEAEELIHYISTGEANSFQIAALLSSLKTKGEVIDEITGFAAAMRKIALQINTEDIETIVDSCGTGGDGINSFNISTASALVAAAAGLSVAKHTNFSFTSKCGGSNVLEALGIPLLKTPEEVRNSLKTRSIAFIHAPFFHKSTLHVNRVRKELGIRTIFNFLGPLTNPASPTGQVVGVSNPDMPPKIIQALKNLGCKRAMTVCGIDPIMDEISICGKTLVCELNNNKITSYEISPVDFGLELASVEDIAGDTPEVNAKIIEDLFSGKIKGAKLDILILNSAAVLWAGNKVPNLQDGVRLAAEIIETKKALNKLNEFRN